MNDKNNQDSDFRILSIALIVIIIAVVLLIKISKQQENPFGKEVVVSEKSSLEQRKYSAKKRIIDYKKNVIAQSEYYEPEIQIPEEFLGSSLELPPEVNDSSTAENVLKKLLDLNNVFKGSTLKDGLTQGDIVLKKINDSESGFIPIKTEPEYLPGFSVFISAEQVTDPNTFPGIVKKEKQAEQQVPQIPDWLENILANWDPDYFKKISEKGIRATKERRLDDALAIHQKALNSGIYVDRLDEVQTAVLHFNLGIAYRNKAVNQKNDQMLFTEAVSSFENAVKLNPDYVKAWRQLAEAYFHLNQPHNSAQAYLKVLEDKPKSATAWTGLGLAYEHNQQYANAIMAYEEAHKFKPDNKFVIEHVCSLYQKENDSQPMVNCK